MKKIYAALIAVAALVGANSVTAQINYTLSATNGTYNQINSGTVVAMQRIFTSETAADEGFRNDIPLGFSFAYGGVNYDTIRATTNGVLKFGTAFTTGNNSYQDDLTSATIRNAIAPLWDDLRQPDSLQVRYLTTGTAPNRIFTIQYSNVFWNYTASSPSIEFQVRLFEGSNNIQFIYNQIAFGTTSNTGASIGLSGNTNYQSVNPATNTLSSAAVTNVTTLPASGQTYTFTPSSPINNDVSVTNVYVAGRSGAGTFPQNVRAYVRNVGAQAQTNKAFTLTVSGANTYTNTINVTLPVAAAGTITFPAFTLPNQGQNIVTVSTVADEVNGNNSASDTLVTNSTTIAHGPASNNRTSGVNSGTNGAIVARFFAGNNTVTGGAIQFDTAGISYKLLLYPKNPANNGTPALQASDSVVGLVSTTGVNVVNFIAPRAVTDTFYLGVRQTGTSLRLSYLSESPLRTGVYFFQPNGSTTFGDLANSPNNIFRMNIGANFSSSLPVQFGEFTGTKTNRVNVLDWNTVAEANNTGFQIQKSADGRSFSTIGFVATLATDGNSNNSLKYSFRDENAAATAYYRLQQVDKDGKTSVSKVIVIAGENKTNLEITSVYPNPAVKQLNLSAVAQMNGVASIVVTDLGGRSLIQQNQSLVKGDNLVQLNVAKLSTGTYVIRMVSADGQVSSTRFIKQ